MKQAPGSGNSGFEIAAAYFNATGDRGLIDNAVRSADALYENFRAHNPPFSGGERDAINCVQLFRVTHNKKHLDLAKHYLDIRGLPSSVNRSGRARGQLRLVNGVAGRCRRADRTP